MVQEAIALGIVGLVTAGFLWTIFHATLAGPLSNWLLKRGQVKWAMRLRFGGAPARRPPAARSSAPKSDDCCGSGD